MKELCISLLAEKGATIDSMVDILIELQKPYFPGISREICEENILRVLAKREVQHAVLTGLEIDRLVAEKKLKEPIQSIIESDEGRYGVDEILGLSIVFVYGTIGITNMGYLDKVKPGIISLLDNKQEGKVSTFIDDLVCGIVAAAASRLAHSN